MIDTFRLKKPPFFLLILLHALALGIVLFSSRCYARTYLIENPKDSIVGAIQKDYVRPQDSITHLAQRWSVGFYELLEANHHLKPGRLVVGQTVTIPSQYILPDIPHQGIVINLAEMRLYYFPSHRKGEVVTYPVGIGRINWATPKGVMHIVEKRKNPTWHVPKSIKKARLAEGVVLPDKVPPGPDNPLGKYAMRLSKRAYLIHGTNQPAGVGRRSSSGCVRLYPKDIEALFMETKLKTSVHIIDQPYKVGWLEGELYLEVHEPLHEYSATNFKAQLKTLIRKKIKLGQNAFDWIQIDWNRVDKVIKRQSGIPTVIATTWFS